MFEIPKNLNSEHFKYSEKYIFIKIFFFNT